MTLEERLRELSASGCLDLPLPGQGDTAVRLQRLADIAQGDLELARLVEAHTDAAAILAEAGRSPEPGALYGVWASEIDPPLRLSAGHLNGVKMFCTGAGLLDRALVTASAPERRLIDVALRVNSNTLDSDCSAWKASAFLATQTATVIFTDTPVREQDVIGGPDWYVNRPGFWHGACGPAACWAGGAIGLVEYARAQSRSDEHTQAHLGAMHAGAWALRGYLELAGKEIDRDPTDYKAAQLRALTVRHLIEEASSDILRRLGRAYGPRALAYEAMVSRRYQELELYIRQSHGERDLAVLGRGVRDSICTGGNDG
jgi:hypothetical protein